MQQEDLVITTKYGLEMRLVSVPTTLLYTAYVSTVFQSRALVVGQYQGLAFGTGCLQRDEHSLADGNAVSKLT